MSEGESSLLGALGRVVAVLDELEVDYLVGGSLASALLGEPRQTFDADVLARLLGRHAEPLVARLGAEFYVNTESIMSAIQHQGSFNLIHLETMAKVDVFIRWRTPFGQSQLARRQKRVIGRLNPVELFFASAEDTILSKLEWYRKGGGTSDRQWRDILGVLKIQAATLDRTYLKHWAREIGVPDLLERGLAEAGILDAGTQ